MQLTVLSFDRLIEPLTCEEFLDRYWERRVLHVARETPDFYERVFSIDDVDRWLAHATDSSRDRALIKGSEGSGRPARRCRPGEIDPGEAYRAVLAGDSLVFEDVGAGWPPLEPTLRDLASRLGGDTSGNLYFTPAGSQTFPRHIDDHDVFIFQLYGSKRWHLYPIDDGYLPVRGLRYEHHLSYPRRDIPDASEEVIDLRAGDLLYVPRGLPHKVVATEETSLHLTVAVFPSYVLDLVHAALEDFSLREGRLQKALPPDFASNPESLRALAETFDAVVRSFSDQASFDRACHAVRSSRIRRQRYPGDGHFAQLLRLDSLEPTDLVERRQGLDCLIEMTEDHATLCFGDRHMRGPVGLQRAFEHIRDHRRFGLSELPKLDDKSRLVLAKRLIRDGLLRVVGDGASERR
jgi:ribosomal protein L16 Arg81 hydroxylase